MNDSFKEEQLQDLTEKKESLPFDELLEEEISSSFSWFKTILVILSLLASIFAGFYLFSLYSNANSDKHQKDSSQLERLKPQSNSANLQSIPPKEFSQTLKKNESAGNDTLKGYSSKPLLSESTEKRSNQIASKKISNKAWYRLIYSSHSTYTLAKQDAKRLSMKGIDSYIWINKKDSLAYKVQLGAFKVESRVLILKKQLEAKGLNSLQIVFQ